MKKANCSRASRGTYQQLANVRMSEIERRRAAYALRDAEAIVGVVIWVKERIESLGTMLLKPGFKH